MKAPLPSRRAEKSESSPPTLQPRPFPAPAPANEGSTGVLQPSRSINKPLPPQRAFSPGRSFVSVARFESARHRYRSIAHPKPPTRAVTPQPPLCAGRPPHTTERTPRDHPRSFRCRSAPASRLPWLGFRVWNVACSYLGVSCVLFAIRDYAVSLQTQCQLVHSPTNLLLHRSGGNPQPHRGLPMAAPFSYS